MTSIEREMRIYRPAIQLDHIVSRKVRKGLLLYGGVILSLLGAICFAVVFLHYIQTRDFSFLPLITSVRPVWGSFLVLLSLYLALLSITFYYNTFYYRGVKRVTKEELNDHGGLSIEAARVMYHNPYDLTQGFLASSYGEETMTRAGIPVALVPEFLGGERERLLVTAVSLPLYGFFSLHDLGIFLYRNDASLRDFLFTHGITEELFLGASSWVSRVRLVHKYKKRWWSRDNLSKREGIGNDFAYGVAFELEQFMRNLANTSALQVNVSDIAYVDHVIESLELILTR